jgi:hypothetical protein
MRVKEEGDKRKKKWEREKESRENECKHVMVSHYPAPPTTIPPPHHLT